MSVTVPMTITAKNEARAIGACLDSALEAIRVAEESAGVEVELLVVLDDCTDETQDVVARRGVACARSSGGKVEAQRAGLRAGPFNLFSDADLRLEPDVLRRLIEAMLADPGLVVAFPERVPLPPRRRTPIARALHLYNARHGYSSQRTWFSGKLFAIRGWAAPDADEMRARAARLRESRFYDYRAGMRVDDIYLSRRVVGRHGLDALEQVEGARVFFRAPETCLGMYRTYRRMRMELERMDALFPETRAVHRRYGRRRQDLLERAPTRERAYHALFSTALLGCRAAYRIERAYYERLSPVPCDPWPPILETKR